MMDKIYQGNAVEVLKTFPEQSVDCCVTSPPYYGLRDYGTGKWVGGNPNCPHRRMSKCSDKTITGHAQESLKGNVGDAIYKRVCPLCGAVREDKQIGLEETPEEYIKRLVGVFREVKRVLKDDGTLWLNIGDTYAHSLRQSGEECAGKLSRMSKGQIKQGFRPLQKGFKEKDLIGIPWMLAFALRNDGWYLRQDIIWHKPNPMPESVKDRCTKSHEYIFLLSKQPKYYFDHEAIQEESVQKKDKKHDEKMEVWGCTKTQQNSTHKNLQYNGQRNHSMHERRAEGLTDIEYEKRNKRDVWSVATKPVKEAHFATFPKELIRPCILAGCRKDGIVLDPFFGSGTTGIVCVETQRHYVGIELNPEYIDICDHRMSEIQIGMDI